MLRQRIPLIPILLVAITFLVFCFCRKYNNTENYKIVSAYYGKIDSLFFLISEYNNCWEIDSIAQCFNTAQVFFVISNIVYKGTCPELLIDSLLQYGNNSTLHKVSLNTNESNIIHVDSAISNLIIMHYRAKYDNIHIAFRDLDTLLKPAYSSKMNRYEYVIDYFDLLNGKDSSRIIQYYKGNHVFNPLHELIKFEDNYINNCEALLLGGNIFLDNKYILTGKDVLEICFQNDTLVAKKTLHNIYGKTPIVFVGSDTTLFKEDDIKSYQPMFHLDLFFTPIGLFDGLQTFILADIDTNYIYNNSGFPLASNMSKFNFIELLDIMLDETELNLREDFSTLFNDSIRIIRIPVGINYDYDYINPSASKTIPYYSFSNMLVENINGDSVNLYIPLYYPTDYTGYKPDKNYHDSLNQYVFTILRNEGFTVRGLNLGFSLMMHHDTQSLHCISKVLSRSPVSESND